LEASVRRPSSYVSRRIREISYRNVPVAPRNELAAWMVELLIVQNHDPIVDRRKRGQAFQLGMAW